MFLVAVLSLFPFLLVFLFTVVFFFEMFETFFEEDRRPMVSLGVLPSLSSGVFVESCEDFIFLDPSTRKKQKLTK